MPSTEDARLEALRSLAAAMAVAYRGNGRPPAGLPLVSAAVDALSRALLPILDQAAKGQGDVDGIAFSWLSSSMAAAAEISQVDANHWIVLTTGLVGQMLTSNAVHHPHCESAVQRNLGSWMGKLELSTYVFERS